MPEYTGRHWTDDDLQRLLDRLDQPDSETFVAKAEAADAIRFLRAERDDAIETGNEAAAAVVKQLREANHA